MIVSYWLRSKRSQYLDVSGTAASYPRQTVTTETPAPPRQVTHPRRLAPQHAMSSVVAPATLQRFSRSFVNLKMQARSSIAGGSP